MSSSPSTVPMSHGELLDLLRSRGPTTRRDLLALSRLSRSTLVERLETLEELDLVRAGERRQSGQGRPPVMLEFDDSSRTTLAVDLGARHVLVAITDLSARVLAAERFATDLSGRPRTVLNRIVKAARRMLEAHGGGSQGLLGVGMSFPGLERPDGAIEAPAVLAHWDGVHGADLLSDAFGVPALLVNDAHAIAYGEYLADGRRRTLLAVKVSTGIGAGLVIDGRLHRGDSHGAGQFGHMRVAGLDEVCTCGERGCLATFASGRALVRRLASEGIESVDDIAKAAADANEPTLSALRDAGRAVGLALAGVATMLDPGTIRFGGTLGQLPAFLDAACQEIQHLTYTRTAGGIEIGPTVLGDQSGVTGLAALVVDTELDARAVDRLVAGTAGRSA